MTENQVLLWRSFKVIAIRGMKNLLKAVAALAVIFGFVYVLANFTAYVILALVVIVAAIFIAAAWVNEYDEQEDIARKLKEKK